MLTAGKEGDVFIIQFGINDRNRDDKTHDTMKNALKEMITKAESKGIKVILVKPQPSVGYSWGNAGDNDKPNGNNGGFFNAVEDVAKETGVSFVNLYDLAGEHFAQVGRPFVSENYQLWDYNANQMADKLHISFDGAKKCAELFSKNASEQGLLKTKEYMEVTSIVSDVYVFENSTHSQIFNNSSEYKSVKIGSSVVTMAPYSTITKAGKAQ